MLKFLVVMTGTSATVGAAFRRCRRCLVSHIHPMAASSDGREARGLIRGEERAITAQVTKTMATLSTASRESCCRIAGWGRFVVRDGWTRRRRSCTRTCAAVWGRGRGALSVGAKMTVAAVSQREDRLLSYCRPPLPLLPRQSLRQGSRQGHPFAAEGGPWGI